MSIDDFKKEIVKHVSCIHPNVSYYDNDSFLFLINLLLDYYCEDINDHVKLLPSFIDEHISFLIEDGYCYYSLDNEEKFPSTDESIFYTKLALVKIFKYVKISDNTKILLTLKYGDLLYDDPW